MITKRDNKCIPVAMDYYAIVVSKYGEVPSHVQRGISIFSNLTYAYFL